MDAVKAVNTSVQSESILKQYLERELKKQQNYIEDKIHRFEISAALDALDAENIQYYQVVCESKYEACGPCKSLDRKKTAGFRSKRRCESSSPTSKLPLYHRVLY